MKKYATTKQVRELMNKTLASRRHYAFRTWTNTPRRVELGAPDRVLYWDLSTRAEDIKRSLVARLRAAGFSNKVTTVPSNNFTLKAFAHIAD